MNELFKSEFTKEIEGLVNKSTLSDWMVIYSDRNSMRWPFVIDPMHVVNYEHIFSGMIDVHSQTLESTLKLDVIIYLDNHLHISDSSWRKNIQITCEYCSCIRLVKSDGQVIDKQVNAAIRKAISNKIKSLIQIK